MELLHQGGHGVGDGVSSHQQIIAEVSPCTWGVRADGAAGE